MAVTLVVDEGANLMPMRLSPDSPRTEVVWDEVSTLKYVAVLKSGNKVTGNFTCVHDATTDAHSLELCVALTFHPHGWIRFQRSHLSLNREDVLRLHIPLSVCEENMFRNALALPDIERLYGMSLADRTNAANGDEDGGRKVATYRELPWAMRRRRDGVQNMPMPTLERVRQDTLRAESHYVSEVLEPEWRERLGMLVVSLLRSRERTREIIRHWHAYPMFQNRQPHEIWALFMEAVLYSPFKVQLTQDALHFFQETALAIPLSWLNADELIIVTAMVAARKQLFHSISESRVTARYTCKDFRLDHLLDKAVCRNFIVHVFVSDCVQRATLQGMERPTLLLVTIEATGRCLMKHKDSRFLELLKRALETRNVVQDIAHLPMFVQIGDCAPAFTYTPPDRSKPDRLPRWTPK
jgi:hypothetical protein